MTRWEKEGRGGGGGASFSLGLPRHSGQEGFF